MTRFKQMCAGLVMLMVAPLWAQVNSGSVPATQGAQDAGSGAQSNGDRMQTPPQVSGQAYSTDLTSDERSNYVRGGVNFTTSYSDNAVGTGRWPPGKRYQLFDTARRSRWTRRHPGCARSFLTRPDSPFTSGRSDRNEADQNVASQF